MDLNKVSIVSSELTPSNNTHFGSAAGVTSEESFPVPSRRPSSARPNVDSLLVQELLAQNLIEPSEPAYTAPIAVVPKKGDSARFCLDLLTLNEDSPGFDSDTDT
jgi:hypothetical protein